MELIIISYYLIAIVFVVYTLKRFFITPGLIFVGMQMLMFSGVLTYSDFSIRSDCKLICVYFSALIMFILGNLFSSKINKRNIREVLVDERKMYVLNNRQKFYLYAMLFVGALCCTYFFKRAGYNVFFQILLSMGSSGEVNFTNSRIAMNNISGVGYIYQFRVIILPLVCALLLAYRNDAVMHKIGVCVFPVMILFLLGTGQRGGFVMFILMWSVALLYTYFFYRDPVIKKMLLLLITMAVVLFAIMTIFNGRVASEGNVVQAMLQRIFDDNQKCAVIAFRYIDSQTIQMGRDWFLSIKDILPGKNEYLQLSYVIFDIMYGSTRGTAPPCIWGSCYYNWGYCGVVIFSFFLGFFYNKIYCEFCKI